MKLLGINDYDISSYKDPAIFLSFPYCSFKCGSEVCQNRHLRFADPLDISLDYIEQLLDSSPFVKAIVCGGLEPLDSWEELIGFISYIRHRHPEPIVIYTGYEENEIQDKVQTLSLYENIIIKFGRYTPKNKPHYDVILGVDLASDNQYAKIFNPIGGY